MNQTELSLKVMVLGDVSTGKTSIIRRYVHNFFTEHYKTTIGVDFQLKQMSVADKVVRLQLWDIAGQERFGHIARVYYKNSHGAMLVYDITRPETFETVSRWKEEIDNRVLLSNGKPLPVVLIGNKADLEEADIDKAQLDKYCLEKGFCGWFDVSAKINLNIDKASRFLVSKILEHEDLFTYRAAESAGFKPGLHPNPRGGDMFGGAAACC